MTKPIPNTSKTNSSWDTYWRGAGDVGAFTDGGVSHPAIRTFWENFFSSIKKNYNEARVIDIASGNGAVIEYLQAIFHDLHYEITSLDVSPSAIENIHKRFPNVKGIVSDARSIPRKTGSFDIVTSQFGVEYAGHNAIYEAARLVSDGGILALLLHCDQGSIQKECTQSLDAIKRLQASHFISYAIEMFGSCFKAIAGENRSDYEKAARNLAPAISELEEIMKHYGQHVAGDTIIRLYNDVGQIHQRIQHYQPSDVLTWLKKMEKELTTYAERMASMTRSAISNSSFKQLKSNLKEDGFLIQSAEPLFTPEQKLAIGWVLIAKK